MLGLALKTAALNGVRCDAVAYDFARGHSIASGLKWFKVLDAGLLWASTLISLHC